MNNDMEKDLQEVNPEELTEEPAVAESESLEEATESDIAEDEALEEATETAVAEDEALEEATAPSACCHDCSGCAGCADEAFAEEFYEAPKKKAKIVLL